MASAPSAPKISLPLADHNTPLVGDELFGLQLNYQWRRVLVHVAENMLDRRIYDGTEAEIDTAIQQVHALISDMYTPETTDVDYLGALVGRTSNLTVTATAANIDFDDDTTKPMHNPGMFWNILIPAKIGVPAGLGGYYFCYGHVRIGNPIEGVVLRITNGASNIYGRAQSRLSQVQTIHVNATVLLGDADGVYLDIRMLTGARTLVAGGDFGFSATLGMYRVGLAP